MLQERCIDVTHEMVRTCWNRFGFLFASNLRCGRAAMASFPQQRWHLDEKLVKVNSELPYLWRAVDHEGEFFAAYVSKAGDRKAALNFLHKATRRFGRPHVIVTERCRFGDESGLIRPFRRLRTLPKIATVHSATTASTTSATFAAGVP